MGFMPSILVIRAHSYQLVYGSKGVKEKLKVNARWFVNMTLNLQ